MTKLLISSNFIVLAFILVSPIMAGDTTYYSPDGKILTDSEYREACNKKAEKIAKLKKMAMKSKIRKSAEYKTSQISRKYNFYSGETEKQNRKPDRKGYYSRRKDRDYENNRLQGRNQQRDNLQERLKINSEDKRRSKWDHIISENEGCPSHLVEIYDYDSGQIRCASPSVAEDLAEQNPTIEIMGQ